VFSRIPTPAASLGFDGDPRAGLTRFWKEQGAFRASRNPPSRRKRQDVKEL
jgi:hypothetical protein